LLGVRVGKLEAVKSKQKSRVSHEEFAQDAIKNVAYKQAPELF
jgi:hypothetical protein